MWRKIFEGKQNNEMSAKEIEAKEMAQELMNMDMYEVGMGYDQMKELLQFIDDSKNMAGIKPEIRSTQESTQYSQGKAASETVGKNSSMHDLTVEERPKPTFSYRQASVRSSSPIVSGRRSAMMISPVEEMSVTSPEIFDNDDPTRGRIECESMYDEVAKENNSSDKTDMTDSKSRSTSKNVWNTVSTDNLQNSQSDETNINENVKSRINQRVERWKLDPTNSIVDENDVPLTQKSRPLLNERIPFRFCHNERVFQETNLGDKVLQVLSHALEEVADIWRIKHRPESSDFQWGSPIKVGANNRNLDKKLIIEEADSPPGQGIFGKNASDVGQRRSMDRNCKRKAAEIIRDTVDGQIDSGEDSSDALFDTVKKLKKSDEPWEPLNKSVVNVNREKNVTRQEKIFNNIHKFNKVEATTVDNGYDSDEFDNDDLSSLRLKNKIKEQTSRNRKSETPEPQFPRRIVPPNPSRPKSRPRKNPEKNVKKSSVKKNTQAVLENDKYVVVNVARGKSKNPFSKAENDRIVTLNDDEIGVESENETMEEVNTDLKIKPMPVTGLAGKMLLGRSRLIESKRAEQKLEESKIQEELHNRLREKRQKEEIQRVRILEEKEKREERENKEKEMKAKEEASRKAAARRDRDRRRKQVQEKQLNSEAQMGRLLMDNDDGGDYGDAIIAGIDAEQRAMEKRVQCPICLLEFSAREVQDHAAECNQFDENPSSPGTSRLADNDDVLITKDDMIFDCDICSRYSTSNGIVYEQHVNDCLKRNRNAVDSQDQADSQSTIVLEAPNSPVRCYVPISKQKESSINYAEQFPNARAKPNRSRIRKRR